MTGRFYSEDEQIGAAVQRELREDAPTAGLLVTTEVFEGVVYLRGTVSSLEAVEAVEEVVWRVPDVVDVVDELAIEGFPSQ